MNGHFLSYVISEHPLRNIFEFAENLNFVNWKYKSCLPFFTDQRKHFLKFYNLNCFVLKFVNTKIILCWISAFR